MWVEATVLLGCNRSEVDAASLRVWQRKWWAASCCSSLVCHEWHLHFAISSFKNNGNVFNTDVWSTFSPSCGLQARIGEWFLEGSSGEGRARGPHCLETSHPRNDFTLLFFIFLTAREACMIESESICRIATREKPIAFAQHTEERRIRSPDKSEPWGD